jgi:hypothetical protein
MKTIKRVLTAMSVAVGLCFVVPQTFAGEAIGQDCVPVEVKIAVGPDGSCAVRDFRVQNVQFQEQFYPWTNIEGSLFNCEAVGETMKLVHPVLWPEPDGLVMPTSLAGEIIEGTLGEVAVVGEILCAGHQQTFSQPFLGMNLPFLRLQNVSVATFYIPKGRGKHAVVHVAFTGAGIMHIEDPETFHIGASTAGAVIGLVIEHDKHRMRNKADGHLQVQGHIFEPDDEMPGMLTGHICEEGLARLVGWSLDDEDSEDEGGED